MSPFIKLYTSALRSESGDSMEEARGRPQKFNDELKSWVMDVIREYRRLTVRGVFDPWEREIFYSKDLDLTMYRICAMFLPRFLNAKSKAFQCSPVCRKHQIPHLKKILSCTING